ncbi:MAG: NAD(+)/NADH kinase [Desulfobacterales bacterium]|jgi:NAD+ kinase|nr:NAD(+)/NADH kinase [Desulfobacteraceae bacterium]MDD3990792.1 NAD(+)/NADH kinase [Desulfobacteraceae bacterium]MDY0310517.1 NAD(+)/NADH kinase [Desulfobacterales bacterium]
MKIGLVVKSEPLAQRKAEEITALLAQRQVAVVRHPVSRPDLQWHEKSDPGAPADLAFVLVLGGDGTFLSAGRWIGDQPIPILGVKFGEVGFLAAVAEGQMNAVVQDLLAHGFTTSSRMRLQVEVVREGRTVARETVLNDLVINKGALARLASIETFIDDHYLTTYRADGLIVATPTGSTAYSLAAGGPVLHPRVPGILLTPICPFTLTNRPLIVPDSVRIEIRLAKGASDIALTFDGQVGLAIDERDCIQVRQSPQPLQMIEIPGSQYFDVLKTKLRWSGGRV